jgi:hypothetical protein
VRNALELAAYRERIAVKHDALARRRLIDRAAATPPARQVPARFTEPAPRPRRPARATSGPSRSTKSPAAGTGRGHRSTLDVDEAVRRYSAGAGAQQVADAMGVSKSAVLAALHGAEVTVRPVGHRLTPPGGSKPKVYDPALVEKVRELAARDMTRAEIAAATGTTRKIVERVMGHNQIPARPAKAKVGADHAAGLKALMAEHSVTSAQVRGWARANDRPCSALGIPPAQLVRAFLEATAA